MKLPKKIFDKMTDSFLKRMGQEIKGISAQEQHKFVHDAGYTQCYIDLHDKLERYEKALEWFFEGDRDYDSEIGICLGCGGENKHKPDCETQKFRAALEGDRDE